MQLKTTLATMQKDPVPQNVSRVIIDPSFVPVGMEDAAILGKESTSLAVWRKDNAVFINIADKLYTYSVSGGEGEMVVDIFTDNKIRINNKFPMIGRATRKRPFYRKNN